MYSKKDLNKARFIMMFDELCRSVNNEDLLDPWLMCGVADGDFDESTKPEDVIEMGYVEHYDDLEKLFFKVMHSASKDGGLYV